MVFDTKLIPTILVAYLLAFDLFQAPRTPELSLLSISVEQTEVEMSSEVKVKTKLTNNSSRELRFFDTNRDCDYEVDVRDKMGSLLPETAYKRNLKCKNKLTDARNILVRLKPKESTEDEIIVTRLFSFHRPGTYFIQVHRKLPEEVYRGTVKSNVVSVSVRK
jgi:hypothetical protein